MKHQSTAQIASTWLVVLFQCFEYFDAETAILLVDFGHVLECSDCPVILPLVDAVLWRFAKCKDEEAHDEDEERYGAQGVQQVAPPHVARS